MAHLVEAVSCELAELVEDGLSGGFVANRDADIIDVEEVREAGEVAGAEDVRRGSVRISVIIRARNDRT